MCGRVVRDARTSCFAILRSRVRTRGEAPLFCFVYIFFSFSYFYLYPIILSFQLFTFLYISDVKIVKLASLSTLVVVSVGRVLRGRHIHRVQWENCYGRDTQNNFLIVLDV